MQKPKNYYKKLCFLMISGFLVSSFTLVEGKSYLKQKPNITSIENTKDLVLGVEEISEKKVDIVKDAIGEIQGLKYVDFCPEMNVFMLTYDENVFSSKEIVVRSISDKISKVSFYIKESSIVDVKIKCSK